MPARRRTRRSADGTAAAAGIWTQDYSGGLVPKIKAGFASWTKTAGVTRSIDGAQLVGDAQSLQAAFVAPTENYCVEFVSYFPEAGNVLTVELLSAVNGTVRFTLAISGAAGTVTAQGATITPANLILLQWVRWRIVVRPNTTDAIVFAYWFDAGDPLLVHHTRLVESGGATSWDYSGISGAVRFRTSSGLLELREISVKRIAGVTIGDSIITTNGPGAAPPQASSGSQLAPYQTGPKSGPTYSWQHYVEESIDPTFATMLINQGTGGQGLGDVVTRFPLYVTDVLAGMSDKRVMLHAGTNDIAGGRTTAQLLAWVDSILASAAAASIQAIVCTILPRTSLSTTQDTSALAYNAALPARASATVHVLDWLAAYPDLLKAATTFDMNPDYSTDGTHFSWDAYAYTQPAAVAAWAAL